jgi:hyperosmotically inducible periplasmic protein
MKTLQLTFGALALIAAGILGACSNTPKAPEVSDNIRHSLDQAGLKDVSVKQDRDKGVVTLGGHTLNENDKGRADSIARSLAGGQVVANEIAVIPPGVEHEAKTVNSDLDKGIDKNLDAALVQNGIKDGVKYDVKNGVVTLKGEVNSQNKREQLTKIASSVPYVQQVVNELQVKEQRATSSN